MVIMKKFLLLLILISGIALADTHTNYGNSGGGASVTWPTTGDVVISNSTNAPAGVAEVDGDCLIGAAGAWTAGSCSGSTSITVGTTTISGGTTGAIEYNNGGKLGEKATGTGSGQVVLGGTITAGGPTGSATVAPIITYNAAGQLTTVSSATITPAIGSVTGLGTGVGTALAINVGTVGAPVVLNGAGGTPSSITLTNATSYPAATTSTLGIVSTDGATLTNTSGAVACATATTSQLGCVKPDGTIITDTAGAITVATATSSVKGVASFGTGLTVTAGAVTPTFGTATNQVAEGGVITAAGPTGSTTVTPVITYNAAGQLTTVTTATIAPAVGSITGLGTGVETALGVNVGSAGAPVLYNGAGGTPTSMTATNLSGTATSLIAGKASALAAGSAAPGSSALEAVNITNGAESVDVVAAAPSSTQNFYVASGAIQYYTSNASTNFTLNWAWSSGTSMNTAMAVGDSVTTVMLVTQGSTAYYPSAFAIDSSSVTPKWQGGSAPSPGDASSIDAYTCSILKTASATYIELCSVTQYK
jgi:hypothetical protein